jgi:hypothetical protein
MVQTLEEIQTTVRAQRDTAPEIYGQLNFDATPHRFTDDPTVRSLLELRTRISRREVLSDRTMVERMRAYTLLGDTVADPYAALTAGYGMPRLITMLKAACADGIEAVPDAPVELERFVASMWTTPPWIDLDLVEKGAALSRNETAHIAPFLIRGAFFATFINEYAALPMAITGSLSHKTAARRVFNTARFFSAATLPGALRPGGQGFIAAAMVRLMHSMVRFNILARGTTAWDTAVYGIPVPQIDQMPAGLILASIAARRALRKGRQQFSPSERAKVELARYQCFLLGLPEELLGDTPASLLRPLRVREATLRDGYDDATCGVLMRATMAAELTVGSSLDSRVRKALEPSVAKLFCVRNFLPHDPERVAQIGIEITGRDRARALLAAIWMGTRAAAYRLGLALPGIRHLADRALVAKITDLLDAYGHAEHISDAAAYRPAREPSGAV